MKFVQEFLLKKDRVLMRKGRFALGFEPGMKMWYCTVKSIDGKRSDSARTDIPVGETLSARIEVGLDTDDGLELARFYVQGRSVQTMGLWEEGS